MEKRIKIFFEEDVITLEKKINAFLGHTEGRLIDIKYDSAINGNDWGPSALLVYVPQAFIEPQKKEERKNEKENKRPKKSKIVKCENVNE